MGSLTSTEWRRPLAVTPLEPGAQAPLSGTVAVVEPLGDQCIVTIDLDGSPASSVVAKAPPHGMPNRSIPG